MRELTKSEAEAVSGGITRSPYTPVGIGPAHSPIAPWGPTGALTSNNYTPPFANINFANIEVNEGGSSLTFYLLPNNSNNVYSGYTVGAGVDISQMSNTQIKDMFGKILTSGELQTIEKYSYTHLHIHDKVARSNVNNYLHSIEKLTLTLTPQQTYGINKAVYDVTFNTMADEYAAATGKSFGSLTEAAATVGADLAVNIGLNWLIDTKSAQVKQAAKDFESGNWNAFGNDLLKFTGNKARMEADAKQIFNLVGAPYTYTPPPPTGSLGSGTSANSMPSYWENYDPSWYGWWDYSWEQPMVNGQDAGPPVLVLKQG